MQVQGNVHERSAEIMKRVLSIQDLSYFGKCSQTIAVPVLSAMGIEAVPLLTSVLSTHTGIPGYAFRTMRDFIPDVTSQWKALGLKFDAIYTGYLGSREDVRMVESVLDDFLTPETLLVVDPAMGDQGKLYPGFDQAYVEENKTLCGRADLVVPNLTELCFLTGTEYRENLDEEELQERLKIMASLGCGQVLLTGASLSEGMTGAYGYDASENTFYACQNEHIPGTYVGTGDLFSSVLTGALVRGRDLQQSAELACSYVQKTIRRTAQSGENAWYSINFEQTLPELIRVIGLDNQ